MVQNPREDKSRRDAVISRNGLQTDWGCCPAPCLSLAHSDRVQLQSVSRPMERVMWERTEGKPPDNSLPRANSPVQQLMINVVLPPTASQLSWTPPTPTSWPRHRMRPQLRWDHGPDDPTSVACQEPVGRDALVLWADFRPTQAPKE